MRQVFGASIAISLLIAALAYLRDPPWVLSYVYGMHDWEVDSDGTRVRWTAGRAAFHVPAELRAVVLPLRFEKGPSDWPRTATVTVDDRPAEQVTFMDDRWHHVTVKLPPRGTRRARRIEIKLDRVSPRNRGLQLADVQFVVR